MSTQTKNAKSGSTKDYFAQRAKRMDSAETDAQAAPIESSKQSMSSTPAETSVRTSSEGDVKTMGTKIAAPVKDDALKSSIEAPVPTGDVDEQIALGQTMMREIIGAAIETDEVSVHTSHNAPDPGSEAPAYATTTNVGGGTAEPGTPLPVDRSNKTDVHPSVDLSGKTGADTASTASSAHTRGSEPSVQTEHTAPATPATPTVSTESSETTVPTPQAATDEPSTDNSDTAYTAPAIDTDSIRRTVKQRKSDLNEYRRRYIKIPRIADRQPVFVSRTTRDRLDRIVRLLGERGMSVSGLIENIALRHLETHEPDVEHWRKM